MEIDRQKLIEFVRYTDGIRAAADQEFVGSNEEQEQSNKEFRDHLAVFGLTPEELWQQ